MDDRFIRKAHSYQLQSCADPKCGMHIVALDERGIPICEIVTSRSQDFQIIQSMCRFLEHNDG